MRRLPLILSTTALAVSLLGFTPLGEAAREALPIARYAKNADKVDGVHASRRPLPGHLLALGKNGKFPITVGAIGQTGPMGPKGDAGPAGPPGLSAVEIVSDKSAADSSTPKSVAIACPAGKKVLGGGAELSTSAQTGPVAIEGTTPRLDRPGWTATAAETSSFSASWALQVWAVCAATS